MSSLSHCRVDDKQSDEEIAKAWEVGPPPASPPIKEQDSLRGNLGRSEGSCVISSVWLHFGI